MTDEGISNVRLNHQRKKNKTVANYQIKRTYRLGHMSKYTPHKGAKQIAKEKAKLQA